MNPCTANAFFDELLKISEHGIGELIFPPKEKQPAKSDEVATAANPEERPMRPLEPQP